MLNLYMESEPNTFRNNVSQASSGTLNTTWRIPRHYCISNDIHESGQLGRKNEATAAREYQPQRHRDCKGFL